MKVITLILLHSTMYNISIILGNFQGGESRGSPRLYKSLLARVVMEMPILKY
jgi:hypothetical protein